MTSNQPEVEAGPDRGDQGLAAADRLSPDEVRGQLEWLAGRADRLKGYSIATAVFDRDDSFDPQSDPVVRLEARRLRRALEHYYLTEGRHDPIRIEIPKGGYVPICEWQECASTSSFSAPSAAALDPVEAAKSPPRRPRPRWHWLAASGVAGLSIAVLALAAATASSWLTRGSADVNASQGAAGRQLTGPAVVVAPFENLSGTEAGRLFGAGLTQELTTDLLRFADLRLYSATSNQRWIDDPASFGRELSVAYKVEGSVLRAPDQIRLAVQLLELGSGRYVWSETYDRPLTTENIFDIRQEIAAQLAGHLAEPYGIIHEVTADLFRHHRPDTLFAYDCVLQAFAYRRTYSRELYLQTRDCLEQAVRADPAYPAAWTMLALAHLDEYRWYGWGPQYGMSAALDRALAMAERALELDPDDAMTLTAYAAVQFYRGEFAEAEVAQRRAVTANPNNPELLAQLGWRHAFASDWEEGIALVRHAVQQSMAERGWYYFFLAIDGYRRGDYRSALENLRRLGGSFFFLRPAIETMCLARLGDQGEARKALDEALAADPTVAKDPRGAFRLHHFPEDLIDRFMDGLRKAGLDDSAS